MSDSYQPSRDQTGPKVHLRVRPVATTGPTPQERWDAYCGELAEQIATFGPVAEVLGGRIMLIRFVRQLAARPVAQRAAGLERMREDHREMAKVILRNLATAPDLAQRLAIAVERFEALSALLGQARAT